jgi:CubicO group peptidase (beta-lactamase class C family)
MERVSGQQLAEWAAEARERWTVPGLAAGLLRDGELVTAADGLRDLERDEQVTPETSFRIASITKPFTATLALTLVQDGLFSLAESPPGSRVESSVRQLLSHQGGLACEWPERLDELDEADDALLRLLEGDPDRLPVGPGEVFSYSNVGFWLIGAAVARCCETTFEEALNARVLVPLGLTATDFEPEHAARGHNQIEPGADEHRPVDHAYPRVRRPSGGLWSSVEDLLRFAAHHLGGPGPLSAESVTEMQQPQIEAPGGGYGLGWWLRRSGGHQIVEHAGSAAGYQSLLLLVPEERVGFAALTNSSRGSAAIRELLERLGLAQDELPDAPLSAERLDAFVGSYTGQGVELDVAREDGRLRVQQTDFDPFTKENVVYPPVLARPVGEREFEIVDGEWRGERFTFPRDGFVCMTVLAARSE